MGVIDNLGSVFIFININIILVIIIIPFGLIAKKFMCINKYYLKIKKMLIFNSILRLIYESYIELCICSLLNLIKFTDISFGTISDNY
jgi:hypothetical protein